MIKARRRWRVISFGFMTGAVLAQTAPVFDHASAHKRTTAVPPMTATAATPNPGSDNHEGDLRANRKDATAKSTVTLKLRMRRSAEASSNLRLPGQRGAILTLIA